MFRVPLEFDSGRTFARRDEIKPWLLQQLAHFKIVVAIERSDNVKIVFRCKSGPPLCPFRVRANFSVRSNVWSLLVVNDNHNHHVENSEKIPKTVPKKKPERLPHTGVFVGIPRPSQGASSKYIDRVMRKMSDQVAQMVSINIWQNCELLSEQKEAAVARFVARVVDEYLVDRPVAPGPVMPLSPLLNDPDLSSQFNTLFSTQLPALAGLSRPGPLPPFNSLQNHFDTEKPTLNPVQLMKTATHDLSEFKVDNMGLLLALAPGVPSPGDRIDSLGNLHMYSGW